MSSNFRYNCTNPSDEIAVYDVVSDADGNLMLGKKFIRTGDARKSVLCNETGQYELKRASNGTYVLPFKCIPRGKYAGPTTFFIYGLHRIVAKESLLFL